MAGLVFLFLSATWPAHGLVAVILVVPAVWRNRAHLLASLAPAMDMPAPLIGALLAVAVAIPSCFLLAQPVLDLEQKSGCRFAVDA
jgi:hypothetical protein